MKIYYFLFLTCCCLLNSCAEKGSREIVHKTKVSVTPLMIELGKVPQSKPSIGYFTISNIGDQNLIIKEAATSCHCTVVSFNKKPIIPGDSTKIKIEYDNSVPGYFQKSALIYSNTDQSPVVLILRGEVIK